MTRPDDEPTTLAQLIAEGRAIAPRQPKQPSPEPIDIGDATVSDLVAEQRR